MIKKAGALAHKSRRPYQKVDDRKRVGIDSKPVPRFKRLRNEHYDHQKVIELEVEGDIEDTYEQDPDAFLAQIPIPFDAELELRYN